MNTKLLFAVIAVGLLILLGLASVFTVNERELAIKFRLGEIIRSDYTPGIYFITPFVNNVKKYDSRVLTLDARPANYLTKEKKNVNVDFFVKWKIKDVSQFYQSMSGIESSAAERIYTTVNDGLRGEFSSRSIQDVISGERNEIMTEMKKAANNQMNQFGVEIVDVRIKRIDFTETISESVYRRMEAERTRVAKDLRSRGAEAAEIIRATADKQRTVTLAGAYKQAQETRGDGDATAAEIYAKAYNRDSEFYSFYRSLEAYRNSFKTHGDVLIIEPDSDFFSYFKKANPKNR